MQDDGSLGAKRSKTRRKAEPTKTSGDGRNDQLVVTMEETNPIDDHVAIFISHPYIVGHDEIVISKLESQDCTVYWFKNRINGEIRTQRVPIEQKITTSDIYRSTEQLLEEEITPLNATETEVEVDTPPRDHGSDTIMTESEYQAAAHECAERLRALAARSGKPVPAVLETVAKDLLTPQPKPDRLKWGKDNLPSEHAADFAARAYAAEYKAGKLTTDLIREEDKDLAIKLYSAKRSKTWPEGIDIPTGPEWNTRKLAEHGGKPTPVKPLILNQDEVRLSKVAQQRAAQASM